MPTNVESRGDRQVVLNRANSFPDVSKIAHGINCDTNQTRIF